MPLRHRIARLTPVALATLAAMMSPFVLATPAHADTAKVTCNDGTSQGTGGYTSTSQCKSMVTYYSNAGCTVKHSDAPTGPQDTLTVTCSGAVPPPPGSSPPPARRPTGTIIDCLPASTTNADVICRGTAQDLDKPGQSLEVALQISEGSQIVDVRYGKTAADSSFKINIGRPAALSTVAGYMFGVDASGQKDGMDAGIAPKTATIQILGQRMNLNYRDSAGLTHSAGWLDYKLNLGANGSGPLVYGNLLALSPAENWNAVGYGSQTGVFCTNNLYDGAGKPTYSLCYVKAKMERPGNLVGEVSGAYQGITVQGGYDAGSGRAYLFFTGQVTIRRPSTDREFQICYLYGNRCNVVY